MRPQPIKIPFETLTPIWTGDADRQTNYIKETSIIGGLRFWTEAVMRSLGKKACNITGARPCILEKDKRIDQMCGACQIFGCTGLGKSFSLRVKGNTSPDKIGEVALNDKKWRRTTWKKDNNGDYVVEDKIPTWPLRQDGLIAENDKLEMIVQQTRNSGIALEFFLSLILMLKWGTIGARDQFMHGMIRAQIDPELINQVKNHLQNPLPRSTEGLQIEDFFFFTAETTTNDKKIPFQIRYEVRSCIRKETDEKSEGYRKERDLRHYFCGITSNSNNIATKYNIGITKENKLLGWGYLPKTGTYSKKRDECLDILLNQIRLHPAIMNPKWREFNSVRDTFKKYTDKREYILNLLEGGWK